MDSNPDFDFRKTSVRRYLAEHPRACRMASPSRRHSSGSWKECIVSSAGALDDEKFEPVRLLWQAGLRSAHAVVGLGRGAFFRRFAENFGEETTGQLFARARHKAAFSLATLVKYSPAFKRIPFQR